jgi:ATP-binding cassette subfamily F protein 3
MVTLNEIAVAYGEQVVLDDISLTIDRGARIALCGANGSGKSTLMRVIAGQASADSGRVIPKRGVSIAYLAQSGVEHGGRSLHEELSLAFTRELAAEQELRSLEDQMADTGDAGELDRLLARYGELSEQVSPDGAADRAARLDRVSRGLGFGPGEMDQDTATFSSGWQMRIALAKMLLEGSDLLLLDEPSNYLDLEARQWLELYLRSYRGGYLLVAHDRMLMDRTCDQVAEIYRGKLRIFAGSFSRYLVRREAELEQMADAYERQQEEIGRMEAFVRKFRANSSKARLVQSRIKLLDRMVRLQPPPVQSHIAFSFPAAPKGGRRALSAAGVRLSYGDHEVIRDLDLELDRGDRLALVGENGVGKSTLMRALAGTVPVADGQVTLGTGVSVGYYAQDRAEQLTGSGSVLEFMESVAPTDMVPRVRNLLGAFLFSGDEVFKPLAVLSGGERSRVALVHLLLEPANLLLLDEPTSHLDLSAISVLTHALRSYAGTLLFASHDEYFIEQLATKVLEVSRDRVRLYHGGWDYYAWKRSGAGGPPPEGKPRTGAPGGRPPDEASTATSLAAAAAAAEVAELAAVGSGDRGRGTPRPRGKAKRRSGTGSGSAPHSPPAVTEDRHGKGGKGRRGRHRRQDSGAARKRRQQELLDELDRLQHDEQRLQAELSDPAIYTDGARVRELKQLLAANNLAQQQTTAAWEETEQ